MEKWGGRGGKGLTWIAVHLIEFSNQLLKLGAKFPHRGAHCHGQMVQPRNLWSTNMFGAGAPVVSVSADDADLLVVGLHEQVRRPLLLWVDGDGEGRGL